MANSISRVIFLLLAAMAVSGADIELQNYWTTMLPHTPMPGAIRQLLRTGKKLTTTGVGVSTSGPRRAPVFVNVFPFLYTYAATETQVHANRDVAVFFLEKDLRAGTKMNLHFTRSPSDAVFLHRAAASSIPFSTKKFVDILSRFSIEPNSVEAAGLQKTLQECEEPAARGERRYCATSLESMVDFAISSLGSRDMMAISSEVSEDVMKKQEYVVETAGVETLRASKLVACHLQWYAYAVFNCHETHATRAYVVSLQGRDGAKVKAAVVCHTDTSSWNPKHLSFQLLQVKPGTVPVCHFLPEGHVIWASK